MNSSTKDEALSSEELIRSMRVKEIKEELANLSVSTDDVFEKEELVQRLVKARATNIAAGTTGNKKKRKV